MEPKSTTVADLIAAGLIVPPATVYGEYGGRRLQATVLKDGSFRYGNAEYSSPSVAAGRAITVETGALTPGRTYFSVNGWKFWRLQIGGAEHSLASLREQLK